MADKIEETPLFSGFGERVGLKTTGIHESDPEGGHYKSTKEKDTHLIKRDIKKVSNDIAEFMAAQLFNELCENSACEISLHTSTATGKTFLASKFFKNYKDLSEDLGKEHRPEKLEVAQSFLPESQQYVKQGLARDEYHDYERVTAASLLLGDKSIHSGNIGVVSERGTKRLVRIDFGAAFRELSPSIDPKISIANRVGMEKNYFLRDHPEKRTYTKEFAAELRREAVVPLDASIDAAWQKIIDNYGRAAAGKRDAIVSKEESDAILKFGQQIGWDKGETSDKDAPEQIKEFFKARMKERQQSQLDMAFEIDLHIALNEKTFDPEKIQAAIKTRPTYAAKMAKNPEALQLKFKLSKIQQDVFNVELARYNGTTIARSEGAEENKARIEALHELVKTSLAKFPELSALDVVLSGEQDKAGKYKVGITEAQDQELQAKIKAGAGDVAPERWAISMAENVQKMLTINYIREVSQTPLSISEKQIIALGSKIKFAKQTGLSGVDQLKKEYFNKSLSLSSYPITEYEAQSCEDHLKNYLRISAPGVDIVSISVPTDAMIKCSRYPNNNLILKECIAVEKITKDNAEESLPKLQSRLKSAFAVELMIQSSVSHLIDQQKLDITPKQYNEIAATFRKDMMHLDPEYLRKNESKIEADIIAVLKKGMTGNSITQQDFSKASAELAGKHNFIKEEGISKDLVKLRDRLDKVIDLMKQEDKSQVVDFTKYDELQVQWYKLCDDAIASFDRVSGTKMTNESRDDVSRAIGAMLLAVNPDHIKFYLDRPDEFLDKWKKLIPQKGQKLIDVPQDIAFQLDLDAQRESASEINGKTRVARLRNIIEPMVGKRPELRKIADKLAKGHNLKKGTYDISLNIDQYMELYESCQKIAAGTVVAKDEADLMRSKVNKLLPFSRRVKSALLSYRRKAQSAFSSRFGADSDITLRTLHTEELEMVDLAAEDAIRSRGEQLPAAISVAAGGSLIAKDQATTEDVFAGLGEDDRVIEAVRGELEARAEEGRTGAVRAEEEDIVPLESMSVVEAAELEGYERVREDDVILHDLGEYAIVKEAEGHEAEARDSVFIGGGGEAEKSPTSASVAVSDAVDLITLAIRDRIINRQQIYLKQEVEKQVFGSERDEIRAQSPSEFRTFLASDKGHDLVENASRKPEVQRQLHAIESDGYKAVHNEFSDQFHDVSWKAVSSSQARVTDVKNSKGEIVCKLNESTNTKPQNVVLSDGTGRTISSTRQVNFPKKLESGKGPVHFSMAVKDENGKNIAEKDAVYFTAHYNKSGKLEEVSSPAPVKFMGTADNAIGYIERNGKAYTLPVTQGKYKEMMQEVALNNGINADLSQSVDKPAGDLVITNVPEKVAAEAAEMRKGLSSTSISPSSFSSTAPAVTPPVDVVKRPRGKSL